MTVESFPVQESIEGETTTSAQIWRISRSYNKFKTPKAILTSILKSFHPNLFMFQNLRKWYLKS
jgi:hypothetical protein